MDSELAREYVRGALDPAGRARWKAHLESCSQCRELVARERTWTGILKLADEAPKLNGAVDRLLAEVVPPESGRRKWRSFLPAAVLAAALGTALGVTGRLATTPSAAERSAAELNIPTQLQEEIFARLDALQTLQDDPWLADHFETVRWLDALIADAGE